MFRKLTLPRKLRWIRFKGEFVTSIRYYKYKVLLYLIEAYYVEVFFDHKTGQIVEVELLDPNHTRTNFYLDQIKLDQIPKL